MIKSKIRQAIIVEGRDDVSAVSEAVEALIIPTHGFGITKETWGVIQKAYEEKGIIVFTDPDFSGEEIRKKITAKYDDAIQAYIPRDEATAGEDIGVENATPKAIQAALEKALDNTKNIEQDANEFDKVEMRDLIRLGLQGTPESKELRIELCKKMGIGYGNAKTLCKKLANWRIGIKKLEQAVQEIKEHK